MDLLLHFWWVLLLVVAVVLGIGFIWRAARGETKHSAQYRRISRAITKGKE